jgi:hypothetical protein
MYMGNVLLGGAHLGAESIVNQLQDKTVRRYAPHWILADPKDNRAAQMAAVLKDRFATLHPQPFQMKVQNALPYSDEHDYLLLTLDTIAHTRETLAARSPAQRATFQITGKGPGGEASPHIALQGTLVPGDQETEHSVSLLLSTLAGMSRPASGRQLTGQDPLTAQVLRPLRQAASRQTVRHLAEKEREPDDLSGGPLSVLFGLTLYPLIPVQGFSQDTYAQQTARALDIVGGLSAKHVGARGSGSLIAVVAVVMPDAGAIHFLKVSRSRTGKRSIAGVTSFVSPRVQPQSTSAVFTD